MALDQKNLRPLNLSPQLRTQQEQQQQQQQQWAPSPQTPPSPRKVKLLCSFGGKILPRPSDSALRYVGGHTRIISVNREIPFAELMLRMSEVNGGVGPVLVKYQLPSEDLDALISVSCPEDLDNMMEEYDKIVESAVDGSAKIRVFLFSVSDNSDLGAGDLSDTGQKYFEAVNGIGGGESGGGSSVGSLKRKDSGFSAGSWNSGVDVVDGFGEQTLNSGCLDPNQVHYLNANVAPLQVNASVAAASPAAQVSNRMAQPLSQFPPLPPAYQQAFGYNLSPVTSQEVGMRVDDCYMCEKMLPHAHSDTLVSPNIGSGSPGSVMSPVFYSQQSEDAMKSRAMPQIFGESQLGGYGFSQVSDAQYQGERPFVQKMENVDQARVFVPPSTQQSPYGFFGNFPQSRQQDPQVQQQQKWQQQNAVSSHYPVKPEAIARPMPTSNDLGSARNIEGSTEFANKYVRPINGMMEGLHLNATSTSGFNGLGNVMLPNSSPLVADGVYNYVPQVGNVMLQGRPLANVAVQERSYVRPNDQLSTTTSDFGHMQNFPVVDPGQAFVMAGNQDPFPQHLGVREPPIPSEGLLAMPGYTTDIDPAYNDRLINKIPIRETRDDSNQLHFDHLGVSQSENVPFGISNTTSPTGLVETFQEPAPTDSLFCNQDPRKILGGATANPLPPKPRKVASRESIAPKDSGVQVHLGNSTESEIIALLEEGGLHPSPDSLKKESHYRQPPKGEEQIKQDLQAVAEGVASSVLNSSTPVFFDHDANEVNIEFRDERKTAEGEGNAELQRALASSDRKIEDNKPKAGLHIADDIGRLQIIKNSDLEELRELGSGTFGTVYHGKWRGTDVAIKRINDRCFAGKPSEQEKMRADFWNEAGKLADLHHPNVVAFYGVVLDGPGGSVATVTEYMVNGSLRTALQRNNKTLDQHKRLLIAMDVAFGMEYLHGRNIVHFDLKSDNLLVNLRDPQRPICKVGDLGLSKVKCQTLISGGVRGTLPWMAPELLNGSSSLVTEKVDVFSFGIVMWELLTGEEPYADLHYGAIIGGIVSNTLRPPVPEPCGPEWRALMEKCWSADPSERPSFTEVAEMLRSIAASLPQKGQK